MSGPSTAQPQYWDLSQIPLSVLEINKVISFCEIISWHPRSCCVFEIFCIMEIILFPYFGLKIFSCLER